MNMAVCAAIDGMFGFVHVPCVTEWLACGERRIARGNGQIVVVPSAIEPQLMNVIVRALIERVFCLVDIPRVAAWIAGCKRSTA